MTLRPAHRYIPTESIHRQVKELRGVRVSRAVTEAGSATDSEEVQLCLAILNIPSHTSARIRVWSIQAVLAAPFESTATIGYACDNYYWFSGHDTRHSKVVVMRRLRSEMTLAVIFCLRSGALLGYGDRTGVSQFHCGLTSIPRSPVHLCAYQDASGRLISPRLQYTQGDLPSRAPFSALVPHRPERPSATLNPSRSRKRRICRRKMDSDIKVR
ncbi:hypothetical protein NMY22_g9274 [Coprinellus aureogranulatus]|nr:hypothetical protein NMY22_g9274 [Coprinellus aureogranulatus]